MLKRFLILLAVVILASPAFAQLSKEEKKLWKKQAKAFSKEPSGLKQLSDEKVAAEDEINRLKAEITSLNGTVAERDSKISETEEQLTRMRADAAAARAELEKLRSGMVTEIKTAPKLKPVEKEKPVATIPTEGAMAKESMTGVVFRVQIGAFRNKNLSKYFQNNPNFGGEFGKDPTDPQRITIGIFRNYWDADTFKKYMREMGVTDAWIVPFKDGKRVEIKDVLDQVVTEPSN